MAALIENVVSGKITRNLQQFGLIGWRNPITGNEAGVDNKKRKSIKTVLKGIFACSDWTRTWLVIIGQTEINEVYYFSCLAFTSANECDSLQV